MADRTLRGSRLGAISYETEYGAEPAPRNVAAYRCERGHEFSVPFSEEAEIPTSWECRLDGTSALLDRRSGAGGQEGQGTAYPLGHADGAAQHRRPRRGPGRAAGRPARPPRPEVRLIRVAEPLPRPGGLLPRPKSAARAGNAGQPCAAAAARAVRHAPRGDPPQRLADDRAAHLRLAAHAFDERDRHLVDAEARVAGRGGRGRPGSSNPASRPRRSRWPSSTSRRNAR